MNAPMITVEADSGALDVNWQQTAGAIAIMDLMIAAGTASKAFAVPVITGPERTAQSALGSLAAIRFQPEGRFQTQLKLEANGGIIGELWSTLEQIRGDHLVREIGGHLYTQTQCAAYSELCDLAPSVEDAVLERMAGQGA